MSKRYPWATRDRDGITARYETEAEAREDCMSDETVVYDVRPEDDECDACGAEAGEPCRFGCLGYAIEHGDVTAPCS